MKFIKKNVKQILLLFIVILIVSGISVYATAQIFATQINYTKANGSVITVANALNELYENSANAANMQMVDHVMLAATYTMEESGVYYIAVTSYSSSGKNTAKGYTELKTVTNGTMEEISSKGGGSGYWSRVYKVTTTGESTITFNSETNFAIFK